MRMYSVLFVCLMLGNATAARAQALAAGVKGGVGIANIQFIEEDEHIDFESRVGFTGGMFVTWPSNLPLALQLEALYTQKGASIRENLASAELRLDYLEFPVLVRVSSPRNAGGTAFNFFAGPSFAVRVSAKATANFEGDSQTRDIGDDLARHDIGLIAGAGLEAGRFLVDVRYTWGLININRNPDEDDTTVRHRVFAAMAGVRF